jgi:hypothetical protein
MCRLRQSLARDQFHASLALNAAASGGLVGVPPGPLMQPPMMIHMNNPNVHPGGYHPNGVPLGDMGMNYPPIMGGHGISGQSYLMGYGGRGGGRYNGRGGYTGGRGAPGGRYSYAPYNTGRGQPS